MIPKYTICPVPLARSGATLISYQYTDFTAPVSMDIRASIQGQFRLLFISGHTPAGDFTITGSETEGSKREHVKQVFAAFFIGDLLLPAVPVSAVLRVGGLNITSL